MALFRLSSAKLLQIIFLSFTLFESSSALDFCDQNYWCKEGHCCGDGRCCSYYYELWWFWLIWVVLALLSCCCFYQQRRLRKRRRRHSSSRNNRSSQSRVQTSTSQNFFRPLFDPSKQLTLPTYEELQDMPKDPPPYDVLYETTLEESTIGGPSSLPHPEVGATMQNVSVHDELVEIDDSLSASLLSNEVPVATEINMPYTSVLPQSYNTVLVLQDDVIDNHTSVTSPQELPDGNVEEGPGNTS